MAVFLNKNLVLPVQHLRASLPSYEVGLYEQNVLTFLFFQNPPLLDMVTFDVRSYGLNCWCARSLPRTPSKLAAVPAHPRCADVTCAGNALIDEASCKNL